MEHLLSGIIILPGQPLYLLCSYTEGLGRVYTLFRGGSIIMVEEKRSSFLLTSIGVCQCIFYLIRLRVLRSSINQASCIGSIWVGFNSPS